MRHRNRDEAGSIGWPPTADLQSWVDLSIWHWNCLQISRISSPNVPRETAIANRFGPRGRGHKIVGLARKSHACTMNRIIRFAVGEQLAERTAGRPISPIAPDTKLQPALQIP